jgi:hypothetical protein
MDSSGAVVAAWIGAGAAVILAMLDLIYRFSAGRRQQDRQMFITALEHFQGSQRRSVGIAGLTVLRDRQKTWRLYQDTMRQLFYSQLLYLYAHGSNRWQEHEISNITEMTRWLFSDKYLGPLPDHMKEPLLSVMETYASQSFDALDDDVKKKGSKSAVNRLQSNIWKDWKPKLERTTGSSGPPPASPTRACAP